MGAIWSWVRSLVRSGTNLRCRTPGARCGGWAGRGLTANDHFDRSQLEYRFDAGQFEEDVALLHPFGHDGLPNNGVPVIA